jgi:hypothetical protein
LCVTTASDLNRDESPLSSAPLLAPENSASSLPLIAQVQAQGGPHCILTDRRQHLQNTDGTHCSLSKCQPKVRQVGLVITQTQDLPLEKKKKKKSHDVQV